MSDLDLELRFNINSQEATAKADAVKESVKGVNKPLKEQEGILERLRRKLAELKAEQEKATSVMAIEKGNIRIQEFQKEITRLSRVGVQGFDDMGKAIPDFERPTGKINRMVEAAGLYRKAILEATNPEIIAKYNAKLEQTEIALKRMRNAGRSGFDLSGNALPVVSAKPVSTIGRLEYAASAYGNMAANSNNIEIITKYNKKLQETQTEIARLKNIGKDGFDSLGNKITSNAGALGKMWGGLRMVAQILPGIGIAGLLAFAIEPIMNYLDKLDLFGEKFGVATARLKALNDVNRQMVTDAGASIASLKALYSAATNVANATHDRIAAAQQLKKIYPDEFSNLSTLAIMNGQAKDTYVALTGAIVEQAKAKAALNKMSDLEAQSLNIEIQRNKIENARRNELARVVTTVAELTKNQGIKVGSQAWNENIAYQTEQINKRAEEALQALGPQSKIIESQKAFINNYAGGAKKMAQAIVSTNKLIAEPLKNFTSILNAASSKQDLQQLSDALTAKMNALAPGDKQIADYKKKLAQVQQIAKQYDMSPSGKRAETVALNQQASLQQKVNELRAEYTAKAKSDDEAEVQSVITKFERLAKAVEDFNKDPKHKVKVDAGDLGAIKQDAIDQIRYKQDTELFKASLEEQKRLYDAYEAYKKDVGEANAKRAFEGQLDTNKTFLERLRALQKQFEGKDLSGAEKERKKSVDDMVKQVSSGDDEKRRKDFAEAYNSAKTLQQQIYDIEVEYSRKKTDLGEAATAEQIKNLQRNRDAAIEAAKSEAFQKTDIYKRVNQEVIQATAEQVKQQIAEYNKLLDAGLIPDSLRPKIEAALGGLKHNLKIGIDQANLNALKQRYNDLLKALNTGSTADGVILSQDDFTRIMQQLNEIADRIKDIDANGDGVASWGDKVKEHFEYLKGNTKEIAQGISNDLGQLSSGFSDLSNALGGNNTQAGYLLDTFGQLAKAGSDAAGAVASFAGGDIVGGISKTISSIGGFLSIGKKVKEMNAAARAEAQKYYDDAKKGEIEYNAMLRQRDRDDAKAAATRLKGLKEEHELLKKQQTEIDSQADSLLKQLQGLSDGQITGTKYIHGTWFRKARVEYSTASLRGASYEDLEKMYSENKLSEGARSLFEQLQKLKNEGADVSDALKDVSKAAEEIFTGTTSDSFRSGFAQLFKDGKTSVEDFTNFFKDRMQDAAMSIFENKYLAGAIDDFYEQFADAAQSGDELTQTEIDNLRKIYEQMSQEAKKKFDDLKAVTGIDTAASSSTSGTIKGDVKNITEETAGVLSGRIAAIQIMLTQGLTLNKEYYSNGLAEIRRQTIIQMDIAGNTKRTADNTDRLEAVERSLKSIDTKMSSNNAALKASGI